MAKSVDLVENNNIKEKEKETMEKEKLLEGLLEEIKDFSIEDTNYEVNELKQNIKYEQEKIERYLNILKRAYEDIRKWRNRVTYLKEEKDYNKTLASDLKILLDHPHVVNIEINTEESEIYIYTDYINIFDEEGNEFKGNKYKIKFLFKENYAKIHGLDEHYCRQSYWTEYDPHPHVDGNSGCPCYGSAGSMLASTMSECELYASFIIVLNFLQQVNIEDSAGKYICNWDCVDKEGNIIENPHTYPRYTCSICDWSTENEDEIAECDDCGEDVCYDCSYYIQNLEIRVCDDCYNNNYNECYRCSEYFHNDNLIYDDGECYCEDCHADLMAEREENEESEGAF